MKAPLIHVANLIFNEPLAIMPSKLEAILHAIGPRLVADNQSLDELVRLQSIQSRPVLQDNAVLIGNTPVLSSNIITSTGSDFYGTGGVSRAMQFANPIIVAQAPRNGDDENTKPYRLTPEGIAVIPVRGSLMKRYNFLSAASGLTTYQGLAQAATAAMGDPQVRGVLFDIDSPGGTTHGCFELSDALYQMRGDKPMWAIANDLAASAAYAIASAADRVWLTRTAGVGSVGVFALHADQSGLDDQAGVKFSYIFAGEKKIDGNPHEPLSKSARADIQAEVDRENDIFLATVARNRGFTGANVEKIQGTKAGVYFAQNAVPLMADEVGTYDEALAALTAKVNGSKLIGSGKLALQAESVDNAQSKGTDEVEGEAMPKLASEEVIEKRAKKADDEAKDAPPRDDEDDDDQPEEDNPKDAKNKKAARASAAVAAPVVNSAKRIAELCQIAGAPELAAEYLIEGYDVEKVIEKLSARRAKASAEGTVNSFVGDSTSASGGLSAVDAAIKQAHVMSANSGGTLKPSQCMERLLRANPEIYMGYLEEKDRVLAQSGVSGGGRVLQEYVYNNQRRYLAGLGLNTTMEAMPGRRSM